MSVGKGNVGSKGRRRKWTRTLAIAVSLWMAGGSAAGAAGGETKTFSGSIDGTERMFGGMGGSDGISSYAEEVSGYTLVLDGATGTDLDMIAGAVGEGASANGNSVIVQGNSDVQGGMIAGGYALAGSAAENNVTLSGSKVTGMVIGGYAMHPRVIPSNPPIEMTVSAEGNVVMLDNSTVTGQLIGGFAFGGDAKNNKIILQNSTVNGSVLGGFATNASAADNVDNSVFVIGNTLELSGVNAVNNGTVSNFDNIRITSAKWGTPVLTLTNASLQSVSDTNIDTRNIVFTDVNALQTGGGTVLIKNGMTGYQGTISSGKYTVGTTLQGTGTARISGDNLVYTVDTVGASPSVTPRSMPAPLPSTSPTLAPSAAGNAGTPAIFVQPQTHNTVMGAEAGMAAIMNGNDFIGAATERIGANRGADGISAFARMGGGFQNTEVGSHARMHTWNAIIALGTENEKKKEMVSYGAFFEYGSGNYTTYDGAERGDGSSRYTGGGLFGKWQAKGGFYTEASVRGGTVYDDARDLLRDGLGNTYSYSTHAPYWGVHIGIGQGISVGKHGVLDVYGRFFYNHRDAVSFEAGGRYDLDAITSKLLRVGARYMIKQDKWNFYGGVAYEYELDGKATGKADGYEIRAAAMDGGTVRGELGATVRPDKNIPVTLDFNLTGYAGAKQGLSGGVSVVWNF